MGLRSHFQRHIKDQISRWLPKSNMAAINIAKLVSITSRCHGNMFFMSKIMFQGYLKPLPTLHRRSEFKMATKSNMSAINIAQSISITSRCRRNVFFVSEIMFRGSEAISYVAFKTRIQNGRQNPIRWQSILHNQFLQFPDVAETCFCVKNHAQGVLKPFPLLHRRP